MSGFDKAWLALRERTDECARDATLLPPLPIPQGEDLRVLDFGAGTGSNLRYLAPRLRALGASSQTWTLIDDDPTLLEVAGFSSSGLRVEKKGLDLARQMPDLEDMGPTLVTASAFFDLVSKDWLGHFAECCAGARIPAGLFVLNVDERMMWDPHDPMDDEIRELFHRHMQGDKGFGNALGPLGAAALERAFGAAGYQVRSGDSAWRLQPADVDMQHALLKFYGTASVEAAPFNASRIADWSARRADLISAGKSSLSVGHRDVFVLWNGRNGQ